MDPFTGRLHLRGKPYQVTDERQADYLERHGLIERIEKAPVEQSAGADAFDKSKRRKARR